MEQDKTGSPPATPNSNGATEGVVSSPSSASSKRPPRLRPWEKLWSLDYRSESTSGKR
jgi:autophagy-related protein 11